MEIAKFYRKKPKPITALLLMPENMKDAANWCGGEATSETSPRDHSDVSHTLTIPTINGPIKAHTGEFLVREEGTGRFSKMLRAELMADYEEILIGETPL